MNVTAMQILIGSLGKKSERVENQSSNRVHPDYDQNTEKSPGDIRRLAVTRTPMENHLLTLV